MKSDKKGTFIQNNVHLQTHEFETVKLLIKYGFNIRLIPPSQIKEFHTPDMIMNGQPWEMKSPVGNGKKTVQNIMQKAAQQSGNIIIDLRRIKMDETKAIKSFVNYFNSSKGIKKMKIITKNNEILDFNK